jgi:predicted TIM-barrel fold metal-dependent hydrolase
VIDAHTHVFNARYLPIAGILEAVVGGRLARLVQRLVYRVTGDRLGDVRVPQAFSAREANETDGDDADWTLLEEAVGKHVESMVADVVVEPSFALAFADAAERNERTAKALAQDEVVVILTAIEGALEPDTRSDLPTWMNDDLEATVGVLRVAGIAPAAAAWFPRTGKLGRWARRVVRKLVKFLREKVKDGYDFVSDYVEFAFNLMKAEETIVSDLVHQYRRVKPRPFAYLHFVLDMEFAYNGQETPYYPYEEQLYRIHQLQTQSEESLLGFSGFDPRRPDWRSGLEKARRLGFLGVKFYPPMGYRPDDNPDPGIQKTMDDFFAWVEAHNILVVSHCSPTGFQAYQGSGENADPKYWSIRLEKQPKLRLVLLHAGGARQEARGKEFPGWFAKDEAEWASPDNYARVVVELCQKYQNVYADLSHYHEALKDEKEAENLTANVRRVLADPTGGYRASTKLMYGSDWHMPRIEDEADEYLELFLQILDPEAMDPYREGFFWKNAREALNLDAWLTFLRGTPGVPQETRDWADRIHRNLT